MVYFLVVILLGVADLLFLWWAVRHVGPLRKSAVWRTLQALLIGGQFLTLAWFVCMPGSLRGLGGWFWKPVSAWLYMWHLLVLPATVASLVFGYAVLWLGGVFTRFADWVRAPRAEARGMAAVDGDKAAAVVPAVTGPVFVYPSRRQVLTAAATFAPQAVLGATLLVSAAQAGKFRVRRTQVRLPQLPRALDGMTIAHISDSHVGRFVGARQLEAIVAATARIKPDLIAFTGDLIDFNLSDLPVAVGALRQLERIAPLRLCVGNHDIFEDGRLFRSRLRDLGLLLNESSLVPVRGELVEVLGLDWGLPGAPRADGLGTHMHRVLARRHSAFPILLAHHPHAFDAAAAAGVPLTLSGHTHGGQIMFTTKYGAGSIYKYWSGLYQQGDARLVVSNGVGNWFPLRVNAPAEIVHLTLRRA